MKRFIYTMTALLSIIALFSSCDEDSKDIEVYTLPVYKQLFLVGDATSAAWDIDNPVPMEVDAENPFVFYWEGELSVGDLKIPVSTGNWNTDFFMPKENGETDLVNATCMLVPGGNPDNKWRITTSTMYRITINIEDLENPSITFEFD